MSGDHWKRLRVVKKESKMKDTWDCTSPSCPITLSLALSVPIWQALSQNLSHPIPLFVPTGIRPLLSAHSRDLCAASLVLCARKHPSLKMTSALCTTIFLSLCLMTGCCSSPSSLLASLGCCAWGSLSSLTPPTFALCPRSPGDMMSMSTPPLSPSPFLSPRLMTYLKVIRWSSKKALLLPIPMLSSASILYLIMPHSLCFHSYGLTPSSVIFVATLRFCRQCCFMILPLLMYHSPFLCHFPQQSLSQLPISFLPPFPPI